MSRFELVTDGLSHPEGPVALPDGSVVVTEMGGGRVTRVWPDGRKEVMAVTGGAPNGLARGPDGKIYCCNNGGRTDWVRGEDGRMLPVGLPLGYTGGWIERIDLDTKQVEIVYKNGDFGCVVRAPNDIVFDSAGGLWFTDHGRMDFAKRAHDIGAVFYAKPDGSLLREVIFPSDGPNGIGLSPDGTRLYVAETFTCRLQQFSVIGPGKVDPKAGYHGPGKHLYRPEGLKFFDSLAVEESGNICVATIGTSGISVISPDGELVEFVETEDGITSNICFGGPDMRDAWITLTSSGRLVKTRWARPGLRLHFQGF